MPMFNLSYSKSSNNAFNIVSAKIIADAEKVFKGIIVSVIIVAACSVLCVFSACFYCFRMNYLYVIFINTNLLIHWFLIPKSIDLIQIVCDLHFNEIERFNKIKFLVLRVRFFIYLTQSLAFNSIKTLEL